MWNSWEQVPTWVCRSQPSPCQICFSLAQFRGWGGRDGLPFRTLFSNFNLHIIRGALPSSFQSIRPCITGKMQPKLLQSPVLQPKIKLKILNIGLDENSGPVTLWWKCLVGFIHRFHATSACPDLKSIWTSLSIASELLSPISNKYWHTQSLLHTKQVWFVRQLSISAPVSCPRKYTIILNSIVMIEEIWDYGKFYSFT